MRCNHLLKDKIKIYNRIPEMRHFEGKKNKIF